MYNGNILTIACTGILFVYVNLLPKKHLSKSSYIIVWIHSSSGFYRYDQ